MHRLARPRNRLEHSDLGSVAVTLALGSVENAPHSYPSWFRDARCVFEHHLKKCLAREFPRPAAHSLVKAAMYPGRRIRPVLHFAAWHHARGTYPPPPDVAPALAIELFHAASIVVDDLLDAEVARRNKIPLVRSHGGGMASLCSHLLVSAGQEMLARHPAGPRLLAAWTSAYKDAASGEHADVTSRASTDVWTEYAIILTKTTSFFRFIGEALAVQLCEHRADTTSLPKIFESLGRCFQIGNDIVDLLHVEQSGRFRSDEAYPLRPSYLTLRLLRAGTIARHELNRPASYDRILEISTLARAYLMTHAEDVAADLSEAAAPLMRPTGSVFQARIAEFARSCFQPSFWLHEHDE